MASQTPTFVPALGSENLWLISEILFLLHSIKLVCLCAEAISQSNSFEKGKCNLSSRWFPLRNAKWSVGMIFRPCIVSWCSSLETFVPANLVYSLVPECAANILTTVNIYSYLKCCSSAPLPKSILLFPGQALPWYSTQRIPVSEAFLSVPALRSHYLCWVLPGLTMATPFGASPLWPVMLIICVYVSSLFIYTGNPTGEETKSVLGTSLKNVT